MISINTRSAVTAPPPVVGRTRHLLTPLPEPGHFLFVVDNSAAEKFVCPTLAANYLVEGREPHPTNAALNFGGALHVGIETLLRGPAKLTDQDDGPVYETPLELLDRASVDLSKFFLSHPSPLDEYRTLPNALAVLQAYQTRCTFPDYNMRILEADGKPLIEVPFELPLGVLEVNAWVHVPGLSPEVIAENHRVFGPAPAANVVWISHIHVAWAGRIDVVAFCNGMARIVDHKTSSQADGKKRIDFVNDFLLSSQTRGYVWAARQLWPELNVSGFCLDAIQFKKPANGCGPLDPGPRGGSPALQFFREYFEYEQASLDSWVENQLTRVEDFMHSLVRGYFPQETTYCFNRKYGKCSYHDCCVIASTDPLAAKRLLHSEAYRAVTWNPTADR